MKRILSIVVLAIASLSIVTWQYYDQVHRYIVTSSASTSPAASATIPANAVQGAPVEIAKVEIATIQNTIDTAGTLVANESAAIGPEIAGRITVINFKEGQPVRKGQVLVRLDAKILLAEVREAEAALSLAQDTYERANKLADRGVGTVVALEQARAKLTAAQVKLQLTKERLAKTKLESPFSGIAGLRQVSVGSFINTGQSIVTITQVDPIKVDFRVPELYLKSLKVGQSVLVTVDARPGERFEGKVYAIDPVIDTDGRAIRLRARIDNKEGLLTPGLFARVQINIDERSGALIVPESAIVPTPEGDLVYVIRGNNAHIRKVKLGKRMPGKIEIVEGLEKDDSVVTAGQMRLEQGSQINVIASAGKSGL